MHSLAPKHRRARRRSRQAEAFGTQVRGLDDGEAVGCPVVCKRGVAIEGGEVVGGALAVGQEDYGEWFCRAGSCWDCKAELERDWAGGS